ncbi:hypothetical protein LTR27_004991 [Elasticomyces elasticus]|nr:hypothetical protein LTR27_004991 [Elasticomyces elasticus]
MASSVTLPKREDRWHFVPTDNPSEHGRKGKPATQEYATDARRHVMRAISHKKRKGQPIKRRQYRQYELEWADGTQATSGLALDDDSASTEVESAGLTVAAVQYLDLEQPIVLPGMAKSLGSGRLDPFLSHPFELPDRARVLLDYMLDPRVLIMRSFRLAWYPFLHFRDPAVYYQALSNAAMGLGNLLKTPALFDAEASKYHASALESVNSRISDPKSVGCDGILAAVIGFALHSIHSHDRSTFDSWEAHISGLQSIVRARGGANTIKAVPLRKMLFMTDTSGSASRDIRPHFPVPSFLPSIDTLFQAFPPTGAVYQNLAAWRERHQRAGIAEIIEDVSVLMQWITAQAASDPTFYFDSDTSGSWISPIIHRCLQLAPLQLAPRSGQAEHQAGAVMQEALRHACILFLHHVRRKFGIVVGDQPFRAVKMKHALEDCLHDWNGMEPMLRWVVVVGGLEATTEEDQTFFAGVLATHAGLTPPDNDVLAALKRFIWFDDIPRTRITPFFTLASSISTASNSPSSQSRP